MGKYTIFLMFENPRRSRQARNFTENDPKILDLKSSSEQIIFRKLSLGAPGSTPSVVMFHNKLPVLVAPFTVALVTLTTRMLFSLSTQDYS